MHAIGRVCECERRAVGLGSCAHTHVQHVEWLFWACSTLEGEEQVGSAAAGRGRKRQDAAGAGPLSRTAEVGAV